MEGFENSRSLFGFSNLPVIGTIRKTIVSIMLKEYEIYVYSIYHWLFNGTIVGKSRTELEKTFL